MRSGKEVTDKMKDSTETMRRFMLSCGVQKGIVYLLFSVFPDNTFEENLPVFREAVRQPSKMRKQIHEIGVQLGLGVTSHIMITAREFLPLSNFGLFTRDYIRRCCDLVEQITKRLLAPKFGITLEHKPLGSVIEALRKTPKRGDQLVPKSLVHNLSLFNKVVYCPAKHDVLEKEEEHMYSVADAVAVTFISLKLCQRIHDLVGTK